MKRLALITLILGSALALVPFASAKVLSDGGGSGAGIAAVAPSVDPATHAVLLRSEGLANNYGDPATKAVLLRSKGLSDYYQSNAYNFHTDVLGGSGASSAPIATTGDSFDWNTALAATLAGMLLIALAATMVTRHRHQPSF